MPQSAPLDRPPQPPVLRDQSHDQKIFVSIAVALAGVAALRVAAATWTSPNPSVIDAATFNPNADGTTLALSAQTNFFIAFQSVGALRRL